MKTIYDTVSFEPGTQYYYGSQHMAIAGLMAIAATGKANWHALFQETMKGPLDLDAKTLYLAPSLSNPLLAGGLRTSANEYNKILSALFNGQLLNNETLWKMLSDHTPSPEVTIVASPITELGVEWHYGQGNF